MLEKCNLGTENSHGRCGLKKEMVKKLVSHMLEMMRCFKMTSIYTLRLNKWGASGSRWKDAKVKGGSAINSQKYENIDLDYEGSYESDGREKGEYLRIASNYLDVLTVDKRAMYIMALEIATAIDGQISEDDKKTWLTIEEFKEKHQDILSLTFDEANEMSLEEIQTIDAIDDHIWEELDRKREEYIRIHGERVYGDEDNE